MIDEEIVKKISQGDLRTTGYADEIANEGLQNPPIIETLVKCLSHLNPGICMRSADALEKIGSKNSALLQPFKDSFISVAKITKQQEVQWHLAQIFSYLEFDEVEIREIYPILLNYYHQSQSNIVKVFSLTTLVKFSNLQPKIKSEVEELLKLAKLSQIPSVKSRAKKLNLS